MQQIAENLWVLRHSMSLLGANLGRTVTMIRLGGQVAIHSTAPFTHHEIADIRELGQPAWLIEATHVHDTYAKVGRAAFPEADYYAPPGFPASGGPPPKSLSQPPPEWTGQLEVLALQGMPKLGEHALFHPASRTLILGDLVFNIPPTAGAWLRFLLKAASGLKGGPGVSRLLLSQVKDREAFSESIRQMLQWDFDRVIVGHGDIIPTDGKSVVTAAFRAAGV